MRNKSEDCAFLAVVIFVYFLFLGIFFVITGILGMDWVIKEERTVLIVSVVILIFLVMFLSKKYKIN